MAGSFTRYVAGINSSIANSAITGLTGDVTATGPGSVASTVVSAGGGTGAFSSGPITISGSNSPITISGTTGTTLISMAAQTGAAGTAGNFFRMIGQQAVDGSGATAGGSGGQCGLIGGAGGAGGTGGGGGTGGLAFIQGGKGGALGTTAGAGGQGGHSQVRGGDGADGTASFAAGVGGQAIIVSGKGGTNNGGGLAAAGNIFIQTGGNASTSSGGTIHIGDAAANGVAATVQLANGIVMESSGTISIGTASATTVSIGRSGQSLTLGTKVSSYNGVNTAGMGTAPIYASGSQTGITTNNTTIASYAVPAAGGVFEIGGFVSCTTFTSGTVGMFAQFNDENNTARTYTMPGATNAGATASTLAGTGTLALFTQTVAVKGSTTLVIKTDNTNASTGDFYAWIRQIA